MEKFFQALNSIDNFKLRKEYSINLGDGEYTLNTKLIAEVENIPEPYVKIWAASRNYINEDNYYLLGVYKLLDSLPPSHLENLMKAAKYKLSLFICELSTETGIPSMLITMWFHTRSNGCGEKDYSFFNGIDITQ